MQEQWNRQERKGGNQKRLKILDPEVPTPDTSNQLPLNDAGQEFEVSEREYTDADDSEHSEDSQLLFVGKHTLDLGQR